MSIVGHGFDLVVVERIARMLSEHGERFEERCFTAGERAYAADQRRRAEHLAGRFAAKEAMLKALGTGLARGIVWTDLEVVREPSGQPRAVLHGRALEVARECGVQRMLVSISHTGELAAASAVAIGRTDG